MSQRWATVDDTSGDINYSGPWTLENGNNWNTGNFGLPYLNSLHSIKGGQGSFTYTYDGTSGQVIGTVNARTSASGVQDPTWTCQVDGASISIGTPFAFTENNWVLCSWDNVSAGKHTITVTATSASQEFLFDRFEYLPSPNVDITNTDVVVDQNDAALQYSSGWGNLGTIGKMATGGGAVVTFPFYGTGISWFGDAPTELPHGAATAQYTIDGGSPTTFTLPGTGSITEYDQLLFQIGSLSLGHHTLQVTSLGTTALTPLVLSNLFIQGGSLPEPAAQTSVSGGGAATTPAGNSSTKTSVTTTGSSTTTTTSTGSSTSQTTTTSQSLGTNAPIVGTNAITGTGTTQNAATTSGAALGDAISNVSKHSSPIAAIVGGVVGGLLVIILLAVVFLYLRRKKRMADLNKATDVQPFYRDGPPQMSYSTIPHPNSDATLESASASGAYSAQHLHTGNNQAFVPKHVEAHAYNSQFGGSALVDTPLLSSPGASISSTPRPYSISNASETSHPSSAGSNMLLLSPRGPESTASSTSKYQEHLLGGSGELSAPRVVNHLDSGYRMPPRPETLLPSPSDVIEYPPEYSAS